MSYRKLRFGRLGSDKVVDFAVRELVRYLRRMDAQLVIDVLRTDKVIADWKNIVWVGLDPALEAVVPAVKDPTLDDAVAIQIENGNGYITGSNPRSVLLAVYRLLRELGCQWLRPGVEGERIPRKVLENICVNLCETPSSRHRGICLEGSNAYDNVEDTIDFLPKALMNSYFIQFEVPEYFFQGRGVPTPYDEKEDLPVEVLRAMTASLEDEIARRGLIYHKVGHGWTCNSYGLEIYGWYPKEVPAVPEELRPHLAEVKGRRDWLNKNPLNTNLCYSIPAARAKMVDAIVHYAKENRHIDYLHVWLADGQTNQCECDACQKMRPADWYMQILNELDEKLTTEGLDTRIGIAGTYLDLLWGPQQVRLNTPERVAMMFCPAARGDYGSNYTPEEIGEPEMPDFVRNQFIGGVSLATSYGYLKQWQKTFRGDIFGFCYHMCDRHIMDPGYERCARDLFDFTKGLKAFGVDGLIIPQQQRCFFPTALPTYAMAKVLWDGGCDYDAVADQYYYAAFGEKADLVRRYLATTSEMFLIYNDSGKGVVHCTDYAKLYAMIGQLRQTADSVQPNDDCAEDWRVLLKHAQYLEKIANMLEAVEQGRFEQAEGFRDDLVDWIVTEAAGLRKVMEGYQQKLIWSRVGNWAIRAGKAKFAAKMPDGEAKGE